MYYSLTFGDQERNTWTSWGLIASSPPQIPAPEPNKNMVNIPGRRKGPIDLSQMPFGVNTYPRITGSWNFIFEEYLPDIRYATYEAMRSWLHGRRTTVKTEDDPYHYYYGLFTVSEPNGGANMAEISIGYDLEPVRYNLDGTEDESFLL